MRRQRGACRHLRVRALCCRRLCQAQLERGLCWQRVRIDGHALVAHSQHAAGVLALFIRALGRLVHHRRRPGRGRSAHRPSDTHGRRAVVRSRQPRTLRHRPFLQDTHLLAPLPSASAPHVRAHAQRSGGAPRVSHCG
eukprot:Amastigsp_a842066_42.p3 type:complete len:138 gc:universal Amastigsp_a842066_42:918-505(-)